MRASDKRVEVIEDGFVVRKRRCLWLWSSQTFGWSSVASIRAVMWDCFSSHAFGFRIIFPSGASVCVTDFDDGWEDFRIKLYG